jgi:hypothetical protein
MKFAKWVFTLAGIYGALLMGAMYFAPPQGPPEIYYGFVGITFAFQLLFLVIGRDPVRFRPAMPVCLVEKIVFPAAVWPLYLMGRTQGPVVVFATIDLVLAALFVTAWVRTPKS